MRKAKSKQKTPQDIQDEILFKMSADKSFKLASDFSMFLLKLNKTSNKRNGFPKSNYKNRKNS